MSDIYQDIWNADQGGSGVRPIRAEAAGDAAAGYVKVALGAGSQDFRIMPEVSIPPAKSASYDLVRKLFDNYALDEQDAETETAEERQEVHDLLEAVVDSAPMQVARDYVARSTGTVVSIDRWYATLVEHWFRRFSSGGDPELSGFEHVFVGEQEQGKVQGYHFWYKYWLDDGFAGVIDRDRFPGFGDDRIQYLKSLPGDGQDNFPESVTISYRWEAPDYDRGALRPLFKKIGGFFVGCSVEGLMALGTVRAHMGARAPKEAVINGARYDMKMFRTPDNMNIRTFYPVYLGAAATAPVPVEPDGKPPVVPPPTPVFTGEVRIVAALVNPLGDDPGKETVTLINMGASALVLSGWSLVDKMHSRFQIPETTLGGGMGVTVTLPKNSTQLSNKGGEITLLDRDGRPVHRVSYSKAQADRQGETIVF